MIFGRLNQPIEVRSRVLARRMATLNKANPRFLANWSRSKLRGLRRASEMQFQELLRHAKMARSGVA